MNSHNTLETAPVAAAFTRRNPLSIAFLFYVVTLSAIIAASLSHLSNDERVSWQALAAATAAGAGFGLLTGLFVSLTRFKLWLSKLLGIAIGTLLGCGAGALALVHANHFVPNMLVAFGGCWIIILIMLLAARYRHRVE